MESVASVPQLLSAMLHCMVSKFQFRSQRSKISGCPALVFDAGQNELDEPTNFVLECDGQGQVKRDGDDKC